MPYLAACSADPKSDAANFSIAMADATAAMLLPQLVSAIEASEALANIRVLPLTTRDPRRLLEDGDADLAVGYFPTAIPAIAAQGADATLHHCQLYASEYVCVMRRDHPLADQELTLDAFVEAHHLLVSFSGRPHGFVDEALAALGRQRRIMLTVNQFATAGSIVARSDLLTVLPLQFLPATGAEHRLAQKQLPMAVAPIRVEMMWHLRKDDDPAHRWLRERLIEAAARKPGSRRLVRDAPPASERGGTTTAAIAFAVASTLRVWSTPPRRCASPSGSGRPRARRAVGRPAAPSGRCS